jgi:hypothetical protein
MNHDTLQHAFGELRSILNQLAMLTPDDDDLCSLGNSYLHHPLAVDLYTLIAKIKLAHPDVYDQQWAPYLEQVTLPTIQVSNIKELRRLHEALPDRGCVAFRFLSNETFTRAQCEELAMDRALLHIRELDFSTTLAKGSARHLYASPYLCHMEKLEHRTPCLDDKDIHALWHNPHLNALKEVRLSHQPLTDHTLHSLASSPLVTQLHTLRIESSLESGLTSSALSALAHVGQPTSIQTLELSGPLIGDDGVRDLALSPHFEALQNLDLHGTQVGDKGLSALAEHAHLVNLTALFLPHTKITDTGLRTLIDRLDHLPLLSYVQTWGCDVTEALTEELETRLEPRLQD